MKRVVNEKIKNIILVMLILSSTLLTYRLWFNDHNLFSIIGVFQQSKKLSHQNGLEYVYSPSDILVNLGESSHVMIRHIDEEYQPLRKEGVGIIKKALNMQKHSSIDASERNNLMSSKSILFKYKTGINTNLLLKLFNINNESLNDIESIKEVIVVQDNAVSDNIKCYIKDETLNKIYKFEFNNNNIELDNILSKIEQKDLDNYVTGYELKHKLMKDDVLLLPTDTVLKGKQINLSSEVNVESNSKVREFARSFFEKFNIVKSVEYKDETKTKVVKKEFIDRKRILRISSSGKIEYTTAEMSDDKSQTDIYTALKTAVEFIENTSGFPDNSYISEIKEIPGSGYMFGFDYSIQGLEVKMNGSNMPKHAIEIEVRGNVVSSYLRNVKTYTIGKQVELDVRNLEAIDQSITKFRSKNSQSTGKIINDIKLVYLDDGSEDVYPYWYIEVDNEPFLINSVDKEN